MATTQSHDVRTSSPDPLKISSDTIPSSSQNEYYECTLADLHREIMRRFVRMPLLHCEEISEALKKDDEERGSNATTLETQREGSTFPQRTKHLHTAEFGVTVPAKQIVNESTSSQNQISRSNKANRNQRSFTGPSTPSSRPCSSFSSPAFLVPLMVVHCQTHT